MKKIILILFCLSFMCAPASAREKNLYRLVEAGTLKVYLADFQSDVEKVSPEVFKGILKETLATRKKENFEIVDNKESADVVINSKILSYKYLAKDPVDNVIGGTTALIVDALVVQNYAQVKIEFTVKGRSFGSPLSPPHKEGRASTAEVVLNSVEDCKKPVSPGMPGALAAVKNAGDDRKLWSDKIVTSVTQTNMPEPFSIPKVLKECSKRFIFLCFGKPKR